MKRRLALLMALVMTFTSIDSTALFAYASEEPVVEEQAEVSVPSEDEQSPEETVEVSSVDEIAEEDGEDELVIGEEDFEWVTEVAEEELIDNSVYMSYEEGEDPTDTNEERHITYAEIIDVPEIVQVFPDCSNCIVLDRDKIQVRVSFDDGTSVEVFLNSQEYWDLTNMYSGFFVDYYMDTMSNQLIVYCMLNGEAISQRELSDFVAPAFVEMSLDEAATASVGDDNSAWFVFEAPRSGDYALTSDCSKHVVKFTSNHNECRSYMMVGTSLDDAEVVRLNAGEKIAWWYTSFENESVALTVNELPLDYITAGETMYFTVGENVTSYYFKPEKSGYYQIESNQTAFWKDACPNYYTNFGGVDGGRKTTYFNSGVLYQFDVQKNENTDTEEGWLSINYCDVEINYLDLHYDGTSVIRLGGDRTGVPVKDILKNCTLSIMGYAGEEYFNIQTEWEGDEVSFRAFEDHTYSVEILSNGHVIHGCTPDTLLNEGWYRLRITDDMTGNTYYGWPEIFITSAPALDRVEVLSKPTVIVGLSDFSAMYKSAKLKLIYSDGTEDEVTLTDSSLQFNPGEYVRAEVLDEAGNYLYDWEDEDTIYIVRIQGDEVYAEWQVPTISINEVSDIQVFDVDEPITCTKEEEYYRFDCIETGYYALWVMRDHDTGVRIMSYEDGKWEHISGNWLSEDDEARFMFEAQAGKTYYIVGRNLIKDGIVELIKCPKLVSVEYVGKENPVIWSDPDGSVWDSRIILRATYDNGDVFEGCIGAICNFDLGYMMDDNVSYRMVDSDYEECDEMEAGKLYYYELFIAGYDESVYVPIMWNTIDNLAEEELIIDQEQMLDGTNGEHWYKFSVPEDGLYHIIYNQPVLSAGVRDEDFNWLRVDRLDITGRDLDNIRNCYRIRVELKAGKQYYVQAGENTQFDTFLTPTAIVMAEKVVDSMAIRGGNVTALAGIDNIDDLNLTTDVTFGDATTLTAGNGSQVGMDSFLNYRVTTADGEDWGSETFANETYQVKPTIVSTGGAILYDEDNAQVSGITVTAVNPDPSAMTSLSVNEWIEPRGISRQLYSFTAPEAGTYTFESDARWTNAVFLVNRNEDWERVGVVVYLDAGETAIAYVIPRYCNAFCIAKVAQDTSSDSDTNPPSSEEEYDTNEDHILRLNQKRHITTTALIPTVTYTFIPEESGTYSVRSMNYDNDPFLKVYEGDNCLAEEDDYERLEFRYMGNLEAGVEYSFEFSNVGDGEGSYDVILTKAEIKTPSKVEIRKKVFDNISVETSVAKYIEFAITYTDGTTEIYSANEDSPDYGRDNYDNEWWIDADNVRCADGWRKNIVIEVADTFRSSFVKDSLMLPVLGTSEMNQINTGKDYTITTPAGQEGYFEYAFTAPETGEYVLNVQKTDGFGDYSIEGSIRYLMDQGPTLSNGRCITSNMLKGKTYTIQVLTWNRSDDQPYTIKLHMEKANPIRNAVWNSTDDAVFAIRGYESSIWKDISVNVTYADGTTKTIGYGERDAYGRVLVNEDWFWTDDQNGIAYMRLGSTRIRVPLKAASLDTIKTVTLDKREYVTEAGDYGNTLVRFVPEKNGLYTIDSNSRWGVYAVYEGDLNTLVKDDNGVWEMSAGTPYYIAIIGSENAQDMLVELAGEIACVHLWDDGEISVEATCDTKGVVTYTCIKCGETREEIGEVDPDKHGETEVREAVEATCGAEGYTGNTHCVDCNAKLAEGEIIPATGNHTWDNGVTIVPATCIVNEVVKYTCTVCDATKEETKEADPTKHVGETEVRDAVPETCGEAGYAGDTYCLDCDEMIKAGEVIPATGNHSVDEGENVRIATCVTPSAILYSCTECDYCERREGEVDPTNHASGKKEVRGYVAETCGKDGYTGDIHCEDCGALLEKGSVIPATGKHSYLYDESQYKTNEDATCTADGTKTAICDVCGNSDTKTDEGSMLPHNYELTILKAATCTETGIQADVCEVCGTISNETVIDKDDHTYGPELTSKTDTTITTYQLCTVCQEEKIIKTEMKQTAELDKVTNVIAANLNQVEQLGEEDLNNIASAVVAIAEIDNDDLISVENIEVVGEDGNPEIILVEDMVKQMDALSQKLEEKTEAVDADDLTSTKKVAAAETSGDIQSEVVGISVTAASKMKNDTVDIEAAKEKIEESYIENIVEEVVTTYTPVLTVEPFGTADETVQKMDINLEIRIDTTAKTSEAEGSEETSETLLDTQFEPVKKLAAPIWITVDVSEDITNMVKNGATYTVYHYVDGDRGSTPVEITPKFNDDATKMTFAAPSLSPFDVTLTNCGEKHIGKQTEDLNRYVEETCAMPGSRAFYCNKCNSDMVTGEEIIPVKPHEYASEPITDVAPTCIAEGSESVHCLNCTAVKDKKVLPIAGHKMIEHKAVAATCTKEGNVLYYSCDVCKKNFSVKAGAKELTKVSTSKIAHSYGAWAVTTTPTVTRAKVETRKCKACGAAETRTGSKLKASISVNASSFALKTKQKTTEFKVTMAAGDSIAGVDYDAKLLSVSYNKTSGAFTITALKKAKKNIPMTIKLASGLKTTVYITVQKKAVAATSLNVTLPSSKTMKVGESLTFTTSKAPFTCITKITYKSSSKKVATVTAGKIVAKKKGKATITVACGKKKFKCKITVVP